LARWWEKPREPAQILGTRGKDDVMIGKLEKGTKLVYIQGGILALMIRRAAKCLGLEIVDEATAWSIAEVNGKRERA
jgi:hypothetical protein